MPSYTNLLFYSATTYIAHVINTQFYGGKHYVWCAPVFNPKTLDIYNPLRNIPASSSPHDIYINYKSSLDPPDLHSSFIRQNKAGLISGAGIMLDKKQITELQHQMILRKIEKSSISDYRPLLYLIPGHLVEEKLEEVIVEDTANPLGTEYRIPNLLPHEFEILEFKG